MRKTFLILSLAALSLLASGTSVTAHWNTGYGWYGAGYHYGYRPYYYGGYGYGYGGYGYGYGYCPSYYYRAYAPYYYSYPMPIYSYVAPVTFAAQAPAATVRQSFYTSPETGTASMTVRLSDPEAQVWFENQLMTQRGLERLFYASSLTPGMRYTYTVRARWTENGRTMDQQRLVDIEPGRTVTIDFRSSQ